MIGLYDFVVFQCPSKRYKKWQLQMITLYKKNCLQFGMYTEPKRAHYKEQFEHNEKVGRKICRCHLPISKLTSDDFVENGKNR